MERDEIIVEMFVSIRGMIYNFSRKFGLEFDDCLQDASLIMLEVWPRIPDNCANIQAYLNGTIRRALYQHLRDRGQETLSLDTPVSPDAEETFADMLQAFIEQDTQRSEEVAETVHAALRKLSLEVQLHTMSFYGLGAYRPALPRKRCKVKYGRKKCDMRQSLKVAFRKDPQVLALLS